MSCEKHGYTNHTYCPACDLETIAAHEEGKAMTSLLLVRAMEVVRAAADDIAMMAATGRKPAINEPCLEAMVDLLDDFDAAQGAKSGKSQDYAVNRIRDLEQTLDRARHCIKCLCTALPVRDVDETLAEINSVLAGAKCGQDDAKDAARYRQIRNSELHVRISAAQLDIAIDAAIAKSSQEIGEAK